MPIDYKGLPNRFFSFFAGRTQISLAKEFNLKQPQLSAWKTGKEKIPWERLESVVDSHGVTWDWLLEGRGPKYRKEEIMEP
jgi:hypothetical protein